MKERNQLPCEGDLGWPEMDAKSSVLGLTFNLIISVHNLMSERNCLSGMELQLGRSDHLNASSDVRT